ncbi:hypothetical protein ACVW1A_001317 [Bradyrhizobium sp. LB1.3]
MLIDEFVEEYGKGNKQLLCDAVERLGHSAVDRIVWYELPAEARKIAKRALQEVKKVDQGALWLRTLELSMMMPLAMGFTVKDGHVGSEWEEIIDAVKTIHRCYQALEKNYYLTPPLQAGRSEILAGEFVRAFRAFHFHQIGRPPPKARTSRFVDFMQAAWIDLDFPKLPEGTLGNIAERGPHSAAKNI